LLNQNIKRRRRMKSPKELKQAVKVKEDEDRVENKKSSCCSPSCCSNSDEKRNNERKVK
jgi:hypothetical protein